MESIYYILKILLSALIIFAVSELGKKYNAVAALIASLPLTSILAFIWLYTDTRDPGKIAALSRSICWMIIPSFVFFITLPVLLKRGMTFYSALFISAAVTAFSYFLFISLIGKAGVKV